MKILPIFVSKLLFEMKIFETRQTSLLDAYTIAHEPIASIDLMERASLGFVKEFIRRFPSGRQHRIVVIAGHGNNGGDALAVARWLSSCGYPMEVFLYNPKRSLSPDCAVNLKRLRQESSIKITEDFDFSSFPELSDDCIVVDGLFGSGLRSCLTGGYARLIEHINTSPASVISIDIPSGLFGEDNSGNQAASIVRAQATFTFQFPKLSFLLAENEAFVGEWKTIDIRLHPDALRDTPTPYRLLTKERIKALLQPRSRFAHKGTFGHALLVAGSRGKMGAAVLAARSCLRTGVGLLTCHAPDAGTSILQTAIPEAMTCTQLPDMKFSAIGIGPGLGTGEEASDKLKQVLALNPQRLVLDADALNLLSLQADQLQRLPKDSVLTPHPKEFDRLAGSSANSYERLQKARNFAQRHQIYLILKGAYTAICMPGGNVYFNTTGNPGMATAGSGDVLTGMLLSLLAQGYGPEEATLLGVYLHGMAGDEAIASGDQSEESLNAGDIAERIGRCLKGLRS